MKLRTQKTIIGIFAAVCLLRLVDLFSDEDPIGKLIIAGVAGIPASLAIAFIFGVGWCRRALGIFCSLGLLLWSLVGWIAPDGTSDYVAFWIRWSLIEAFLITVVAACFNVEPRGSRR